MLRLSGSSLMIGAVALCGGCGRQQALRGTYDPAYLNYTMGKLMVRKLRDDWTRDRGGQGFGLLRQRCQRMDQRIALSC